MYYLQSRYYDSATGRFINADEYASIGQGILGYNMYAYCKNNPFILLDNDGNDPITAAAIGGAIAGAVISAAFYLHNSGDEASLGEAALVTMYGALAGALGGAASMATGDLKIACVLGAGIVSGLSSDCTGGSFWISGILGTLGTYGGTLIDTSMFTGFELGAANYLTSIYMGFGTEMVSQITHEVVPDEVYSPKEPVAAKPKPIQKPAHQRPYRYGTIVDYLE